MTRFTSYLACFIGNHPRGLWGALEQSHLGLILAESKLFILLLFLFYFRVNLSEDDDDDASKRSKRKSRINVWHNFMFCDAPHYRQQVSPNPKVAVVGTMVRTTGPGMSVSNQYRLLHVR